MATELSDDLGVSIRFRDDGVSADFRYVWIGDRPCHIRGSILGKSCFVDSEEEHALFVALAMERNLLWIGFDCFGDIEPTNGNL